MDWSLDHGPINIWYVFDEDLFKTLICRVLIRKKEKKLGPQEAANVTNESRQ